MVEPAASRPVREIIMERLPAMSELERRIAEFTLAHYRDCAMLNIGELAIACGISNTTVNRFARNLGFDGYHEYRRTLRDETSGVSSSVSLLKTMIVGGSSADILQNSIAEDARLIEALRRSVDPSTFTRAVERLVGARRVFVLGKGTSAYLAQYLTFNLLGVGVDASEFGDTAGVEGAARRALQITERDVVVAIAFPRFSRVTRDLLEVARSAGCFTVAITSSLSGSIARSSDSVLLAPARRGLHSGSGVPAMVLIEALLTAVTALAGSAESTAARLAPLIDHELVD